MRNTAFTLKGISVFNSIIQDKFRHLKHLGVALTSYKISSRAATIKLQARRNHPRRWLLSLAPLLSLEKEIQDSRKHPDWHTVWLICFLDLMGCCIDRPSTAEHVPVLSRLSLTYCLLNVTGQQFVKQLKVKHTPWNTQLKHMPLLCQHN